MLVEVIGREATENENVFPEAVGADAETTRAVCLVQNSVGMDLLAAIRLSARQNRIGSRFRKETHILAGHSHRSFNESATRRAAVPDPRTYSLKLFQ